MKIDERLQSVSRLFLDTAPIVYFVEAHNRYLPRVAPVFARLDAGSLVAVTSPISLAECLVVPYRENRPRIRQAFIDLITGGSNTQFVSLEQEMADKAAEIRARYNLALADALQIAVAIVADCDSFLTNDHALKRIAELDIVVLDDLNDT